MRSITDHPPGASTANISLRSIYVVCNTNLAACGGGLTWALLEYFSRGKFSIVGFCSGIIAGLVGITPAAGFVPISVAALIGALTACASFLTARYKHLLRIDEGLDIFAIHGVGGFVGDVLTGFFAADYVPALDGRSNMYAGGWWMRNWKQMGYQLAAASTCAVWSFVVSLVLFFIIDRIPGCYIRATEEDELRGLDYKYFLDVEGDFDVLDGYGATTMGTTTSGLASPSPSREGVVVPMPSEKRD
jgi:Amt family ammonium transporter